MVWPTNWDGLTIERNVRTRLLMSQREQATERMIQGTSRKQLTSGDGYRHTTVNPQSRAAIIRSELAVTRWFSSILGVFSSWTETSKGGIHEPTFVFPGRVRVHILTEDRPA